MRVFCVSDVHTDIGDNMEYLTKKLSQQFSNKDDILIIAGDISHQLPVIQSTLEFFSKLFFKVFYCPGNHELWVRNASSVIPDTNSIEKFEAILRLCKKLKVSTKPELIVDKQSGNRVRIVPLYSWYTLDFDVEEPASKVSHQEWTSIQQHWKDFNLCYWPIQTLQQYADFHVSKMKLVMEKSKAVGLIDDLNIKNHHCISNYFLNYSLRQLMEEGLVKNQSSIPTTTSSNESSNTSSTAEDKKETIISYSHFIPRFDLLPSKKVILAPNLHKVSGDAQLETLIRDVIHSNIHVFGHSHIDVDKVVDGVRYVQHAFGYPRERTTWKASQLGGKPFEIKLLLVV